MKINFKEELRDLDGKTIPLDDSNSPKPLTLRRVCVVSLVSTDANDKIKAEDKFKQALLAEKITNNDELDLKVEDIKLLKDLIGKFWSPVAVLRAWNLLDPPAEDSEEPSA